MPPKVDPLFSKQWHFKLLGDIQTIWSEFSGKGVKVGVFDDGLEYRHPDLGGNYSKALHLKLGNRTFDPAPLTRTGEDPDAHGTAVAGLIAAERNGKDGMGVAWGATLTGVNILTDPALESASSETVLAWGGKFDVMNNSWGFDPLYNGPDERGIESVEAEIAGFTRAAAEGRGGLGTVIVMAAGNDGANANGDLLTGMFEILTIAAIDRKGLATSYSSHGSSILVAAPEASVTTDLIGSSGYNTNRGTTGNVTTNFNGTSAAAPIVSGVAALMLDAAPSLGWRDVREILATSARMTGSIRNGDNETEVALPRFQNPLTATGVLDGDTWNDGGRFFSGDYGYGRVDAYAAVRLAEVWSLLHPVARTSANVLTVNVETEDLAEFGGADGDKASLTLNVTDSLRIEHIDLQLNLLFDTIHPNTDEPLITLYSPSGTVLRITFGLFKLQNPDWSGSGLAEAASEGLRWSFGIAHAIGLNSQGEWRVEIENMAPTGNGGGLFGDIALSFLGSAWDTDNVHHITMDWGLAHAKDATAGRDRTISDVNGGTDWIEMATIAANVTANLAPGADILVRGNKWASIGADAALENIVTGDGNDGLTGNDLSNALHGMRGRDTLAGGIGDDSLFGGAGRDRLSGDIGADVLSGGADADRLSGGAGDDRLTGGAGNDRLTGGDGVDSFVFTRRQGIDTVTDFTRGIDRLVLDDALWNGAALSAQTVVNRFAKVQGDDVVFTFRDGRVVLDGLGDTSGLADDILFI